MNSESNATKTKKKRVSVACKQCNAAHSSCEDARPCRRCVEKGIGHLCQDNLKRIRKDFPLEEIPSNQVATIPIFVPSIQAQPAPQSDNQLVTDFSDIADLSPELRSILMSVFYPLESSNEESKPEDIFTIKEGNEERTALKRLLFTELQAKFPEESAELMQLLQSNSESFIKYYKTNVIKRKSVEELASSIEATVKQVASVGEIFSVPTIIWDRHGVVYYVNTAYKQLTGFPFTLPTDKNELAMFQHIFSLRSFLEFSKVSLKSLNDYPKNLQFNSHVFPASVKLHKQVGDKYVDGTMSVSFKQDTMGFSFLFVGNFLPSATEPIRTEIPRF